MEGKFWNIELLKYGMEDFINRMKNFPYFHTFFILGHFNVVFILSAVNKAAFDQMHQIIEKSKFK